MAVLILLFPVILIFSLQKFYMLSNFPSFICYVMGRCKTTHQVLFDLNNLVLLHFSQIKSARTAAIESLSSCPGVTFVIE